MRLSRRQFFTDFGRSFLTKLVPRAAAEGEECESVATSGSGGTLQAWVRPPGAVPEAQFLRACTQCTACQEACPHDSIRRLGPEFGAQAGTPAIVPRESPCYLCEGLPCISACETDALLPTSVRNVSMGVAVLRLRECYVAQGQPCDYCVARCPLKSHAISYDDRGLPVVDQDGCVGCGVCDYVCPADALSIVPP